MITTNKKNPYLNYGIIPSKQQGGKVAASDEVKEKLFPYFAYLYSQQLDPEKYGTVQSIDEWVALIQENEKDIEIIVEAAKKLTPEDWESLEMQYNESQKETNVSEEIQYAAKGKTLKKLKSVQKIDVQEVYKKGGKSKNSSSRKKCKCGCDLILSKGAGGKIIQKCSCGCKGVK